jgi:hypothetical protein
MDINHDFTLWVRNGYEKIGNKSRKKPEKWAFALIAQSAERVLGKDKQAMIGKDK